LDEYIPEIRADYGKMEQAFINLLLNAIDASNKGDKIQITSQYELNGRHPRVEITIDDNGSNIPEEYLDEIFKPFFTTKTKGTGLGLATVKRIVEAHGGLVKAENRNPYGVSFSISFPIGADNG
jgi:signal transduction histidine kinase